MDGEDNIFVKIRRVVQELRVSSVAEEKRRQEYRDQGIVSLDETIRDFEKACREEKKRNAGGNQF